MKSPLAQSTEELNSCIDNMKFAAIFSIITLFFSIFVLILVLFK